MLWHYTPPSHTLSLIEDTAQKALYICHALRNNWSGDRLHYSKDYVYPPPQEQKYC